MKKFILTLLTLVLIAGSAYADGRKKVIDPDRLPQAATTTIQKHWPSCVIDMAYIDGREYEVLLSDGTLIEFDMKGVWKEMKCTDGLPVTLVPGNITRYVVNRFPKQLIIKCEKMRGGYEIELTNGLEIQFDMQGRVTHVDD
ncbi:MAG: PepSY-like domain-containing protein [Bacteroidales bacterium]|jgi:hypothetical protein|nr:PepSY-like domain-containing protein [Bacteroidales bacterium]